jgi:hypothetical protein
MPIVSYDLHGDFSKPGSFNDAEGFGVRNSKGRSLGFTKDAKIVSTASSIEKFKRAFAKTPFLFAFHMINHPMSPEYQDDLYSGELQQIDDWTTDKLKQIFNVNIAIDQSAINVVLLGNNATQRDQMSGWILAHRFAHALHQHVPNDPASILDETIRTATGKIGRLLSIINQAALWDTMSKIFTMKSARTNQLEEPGLECICQYLIVGRVILSRIDPRLDEIIAELEQRLNTMIKQMMELCVGKLFVWF